MAAGLAVLYEAIILAVIPLLRRINFISLLKKKRPLLIARLRDQVESEGMNGTGKIGGTNEGTKEGTKDH